MASLTSTQAALAVDHAEALGAGLEDSADSAFAGRESLLVAFALSDIADDGEQGRLAPQRNPNQGDFTGEFRAVPALVDPIEAQGRAHLHGRC